MSLRFFTFGRSELLTMLIILLILAGVLVVYAFFPARSEQNADIGDDNRVSILSVAENRDKGGTKEISMRSRDTADRAPNYVGAPTHQPYTPKERWAEGTVLDLNTIDSAGLTKVPGIGATFARRIIKYREQLRGYYTVLQLQEVYGMTYDRYTQLKPWFAVKTPPLPILADTLRYGHVPRHPYLSWQQRSAIDRLLRRQGRLQAWQELSLLEVFTKDDSIRLAPYLIFPKEELEQQSTHENKDLSR